MDISRSKKCIPRFVHKKPLIVIELNLLNVNYKFFPLTPVCCTAKLFSLFSSCPLGILFTFEPSKAVQLCGTLYFPCACLFIESFDSSVWGCCTLPMLSESSGSLWCFKNRADMPRPFIVGRVNKAQTSPALGSDRLSN